MRRSDSSCAKEGEEGPRAPSEPDLLFRVCPSGQGGSPVAAQPPTPTHARAPASATSRRAHHPDEHRQGPTPSRPSRDARARGAPRSATTTPYRSPPPGSARARRPGLGRPWHGGPGGSLPAHPGSQRVAVRGRAAAALGGCGVSPTAHDQTHRSQRTRLPSARHPRARGTALPDRLGGCLRPTTVDRPVNLPGSQPPPSRPPDTTAVRLRIRRRRTIAHFTVRSPRIIVSPGCSPPRGPFLPASQDTYHALPDSPVRPRSVACGDFAPHARYPKHVEGTHAPSSGSG